MPDKPQTKVRQVKLGEPVKSPDFRSVYANNVFFEPTAFDLRMTVGEVMGASTPTPHVEQRAAITMSWLEAKLAVVFFLVNVLVHENTFGPIQIPDAARPQFIPKNIANGSIAAVIAGALEKLSKGEMEADEGIAAGEPTKNKE